MNHILVTGAAGFIGFHVAEALLKRGYRVVGIDNLNSYYDVGLKRSRLQELRHHSHFTFEQINIADRESLSAIFKAKQFPKVIHLAAQAGVRYSLENPQAYVDSNLVGFMNILENCRHHGIRHLVFASSSSVYGSNRKIPFSITDRVDHPISLYAATKRSNELMAHVYAHLYGFAITGLRFFTVYGPWGRPDMATFSFTRAILEGKPIKVFNYGKMRRDFTYVSDVVEGVIRLTEKFPEEASAITPGGSEASACYRIYNIGNNKPIELLYLIDILQEKLGRKAKLEMLPMQPGDVLETYADVDALMKEVNYRPNTPIEQGLEHFVRWYCGYYNVDSLAASNT